MGVKSDKDLGINSWLEDELYQQYLHDRGSFWNDGGAAQRQDFKEMHPGAGHPVHAARRMVNGVESPQPWNAMKRAMDPVLDEVSQKHDGR